MSQPLVKKGDDFKRFPPPARFRKSSIPFAKVIDYRSSVEPLDKPDIFHLSAAVGWLELGNWQEANEELERISPTLRGHPDVLEVRLQIFAKAGKWEPCIDLGDALVRMAPAQSFGWIHRSFALHELKRTQEAFDRLPPAATNFPKEWTIPYNLACYCAQLGRVDESKDWFQKAMTIDNKAPAKAAVGDADLKPLWDSMAGGLWKRE